MPQPADPPLELRDEVEGARETMRAGLLGGAGGLEACQAFASTCDQLVKRFVLPEAASALALVATGGWGRREMCPFSDLDIWVLAPPDALAVVERQMEALLYPLWDAGLKVGHSVHDPASVTELACSDVPTATSLLDARLIAGDESLFEQLVAARQRAIAPGGDPSRFVAGLVEEQKRRHRRFGETLYLLEPNIKHGIGGLRDLGLALWVAQVRFGFVASEKLVTGGQLTRRQAEVLESSRDFLLRLRSLLQLHTRRATDQLTFEVQEALAPLLYPEAVASSRGPIEASVAPSVEALMRDYYVHATGVMSVVKQLFEAAQSSRRRRPSVAQIDGSFLSFSGKLSVASAEVFDRRPEEMLRVFRLSRELDIPLHWHTRELITNRTDAGLDLTANRTAGSYFVAALVDEKDDYQPSLLEGMHRVGLLASVIPELGPCTCRVQHDLYHVYTVDQHQLYAVNMLKRLARGELADELPGPTAAYAELVEKRALYLATLLHDVGKPLGKGHSESGGRIAERAAIRLGLPRELADRAALLVRQHLTMSHISQRRDLSDPEVIRRFADRVGDLTTLRELYLLTIVDTAMTAPGNLSPWKARLLGELYRRTRSVFLGDQVGADEPSPELLTRRRRERTRELLEASGCDDAAELTAAVDDHVALALSPHQLKRLLLLVSSRGDAPFATKVRAFPLKGHSELAFVADDAHGLLADVTGALAVVGVNVRGAVIGTMERGGARIATNVFFVRLGRGEGGALPVNDPRWQRLEAELERALGSGRDPDHVETLLEARREKGLPPRVTPHIDTEVRFAADASTSYAVLEVFCEDRLGLLSDVARTLRALRVDIHLAMVSTEGEKIADVFYVLDADTGEAPTAERQSEIVGALRAMLDDSEDDA